MCAVLTGCERGEVQRNECANPRYVQRPAEAGTRAKLEKQNINDKPKVTPNPFPPRSRKNTAFVYMILVCNNKSENE